MHTRTWTRPPSPSSPSATGRRCESIATACSAPSRNRRTPYRRRSCAPGEGRETFEGRSTFRAWLYRIATNACLDALGRRERSLQVASGPEVPWLQPFPDRLLEELPAHDEDPDAAVVAKETIELAFIAA